LDEIYSIVVRLSGLKLFDARYIVSWKDYLHDTFYSVTAEAHVVGRPMRRCV
jgi:hypothetical protein